MKSANLFASLIFVASLCATGSAFAQQDSRGVLLMARDFSDCSNSDVTPSDVGVKGYVTVDRDADGKTHVRADLLGTPNTTYHFFLKCVRLIGDITTQSDGTAIANFDFPTNWAGDVFAFDMYPEGAPSGNKFQSVQVNFRQPASANWSISFLPPGQQISRGVMILPQPSSDCSNADILPPSEFVSGGVATVDRGVDGSSHVRVRLIGQPNTTYHFFLKCVRQLGDLTTQATGAGIANFDFRTDEVGDVFAFEMYPEGTLPANRWQSVRVVFGDAPPDEPPPVLGTSPRIEYVEQTGRTVRFTYANMPSGTQIIGIYATSNARVEAAAYPVSQAGDGSAAITFPDGSEGKYYLLAQRQSGEVYLAQTIDFYVYPPPGG